MSRTIGDELRDNAVHLRNARNAIIGRGGTIASNAGWKDVPEAVLFIPNDASVAISATESNAYKVPVPTTSQGVARIDALGGNTRIVPGVNLINWADRFGYAVKPRVNDQEDYYSIDTIPSGRYRLYIDARPTIEDDCISLGYGFTTDMSVFYSSGDYIELNANSTIYAWCGASTWNSADPNISAMFNGTPIALDKTHTLTIGGASADGTPDFGYVTIATNTRVKVSLSHEFTNASEKGKTFIVGKGNYTFYWENAEVGTDLIATITLSHEIPYSVEARVYPMIYAVPDDSVEYILTEYEPYTEHLVPTAVTEIVSKGANLWDDVAYLKSNGFTLQTDEFWSGKHQWNTIYTNSEQKEGQITISYTAELLTVEGSNTYYPIFFYFNYTDGTQEQKAYMNYNAVGVKNLVGTSNANKTVAKIVWGASQACTLKIKDIMINWGDSAAPYKPYSAEPIDTVAIPDAVKNDAGWGHGFTYVQDNITYNANNAYNFADKTYTKEIVKIILDGSEGRRFISTDTMSAGGKDVRRFLFPIDGRCKNNTAVKATRFITSYNTVEGRVYLYGYRAIFMLPSNITTLGEGNNWLKENPVEMVYAVESPTITTIDDAPDKYINVEGGGEIVLKNNAEAAVPSTITFIRRI